MRVQQMMRGRHYATREIYAEEVQKLLEGKEEAVTQIQRCSRFVMSAGRWPSCLEDSSITFH